MILRSRQLKDSEPFIQSVSHQFLTKSHPQAIIPETKQQSYNLNGQFANFAQMLMAKNSNRPRRKIFPQKSRVMPFQAVFKESIQVFNQQSKQSYDREIYGATKQQLFDKEILTTKIQDLQKQLKSLRQQIDSKAKDEKQWHDEVIKAVMMKNQQIQEKERALRLQNENIIQLKKREISQQIQLQRLKRQLYMNNRIQSLKFQNHKLSQKMHSKPWTELQNTGRFNKVKTIHLQKNLEWSQQEIAAEFLSPFSIRNKY